MSLDDDKFIVGEDTLNEIRNRSSEDYLESKLETVWMKKGYSKSSVKEYVNHLLQELNYQKDSFSLQMKELIDEKERLINEKSVLSKQLEDSVAALNNIESSDSQVIELQKVINNLTAENEELKKDDKSKIISQLKKQLDESNDYNNQLKSQIIDLKFKTLQSSNPDIDELLNKISFLEKENQELRENIITLNEQIKKKYSENAAIEIGSNNSTFDLQNSELERYKNDNKMLNVEMLALNRLIKDLTQRDEKNGKKILDLENFIDELKVSYHDKLKEVETSYNIKIDKLSSDYRLLKVEFDDIQNERSLLLSERTELQGRLATGIEYLNELYDKVDYLQSSNKVLNRQLEEQRTKNRMISGLEIPEFSSEVLKSMNRELLELKKESLEIQEPKLDND